jgi:hypothetical protein
MRNVALSLYHVPLLPPGVGDGITSAREAPPDGTPRERPLGRDRAKQHGFGAGERMGG